MEGAVLRQRQRLALERQQSTLEHDTLVAALRREHEAREREHAETRRQMAAQIASAQAEIAELAARLRLGERDAPAVPAVAPPALAPSTLAPPAL